MIYWLKSDGDLSESLIKDIFEANLELYNVITIFMTSSEMSDMFDLLNRDSREFGDQIEAWSTGDRSCFRYYIVGPVAAGKSTLLEHLRCFETYEEWTSLPPPEMYLSFDKLTPEQNKTVDNFIYRELKEKNRRFSGAGVGFHFMDRAPLDLYAFSVSDDERRAKTKELKARVVRDMGFAQGEIIFISAGGKALVKRNLGRGRSPTEAGKAEYLEKQTIDLKNTYTPKTTYETDGCDAAKLAKLVSRHVLLDEYEPTDLNEIMAQYT